MTTEELLKEAWWDGYYSYRDHEIENLDRFIKENQPAINQAKRELIQDFANWNNKEYTATISVYPMVRIVDSDIERYMESIS